MSQLSSRAQVFSKPSLPYVSAQINALHNLHSSSNPTGKIPLAVAENKLCKDMLIAKIKSLNDYSDHVMNYTSASGSFHFRGILAKFLSKYLFEGHVVDLTQLVVTPGCCAGLHQLSMLLFEPGDVILVPSPYYPAFDADFLNMGGVHTVAVHAPQSPSAGVNARIYQDSLERTYQEVVASGRRVRGLLLTNPSNPLGLIFTEETMKMSVDWARSHGLHIIVDEIYALSTFGDKQTDVGDGFAKSFRSVVSVLGNQLDNDVHVLWSLSKDFGGSGLRLGVVYSQNKDLIRVLGASNDAFQVSNVIQEIAGHLLSDFDFVDNYLATNSQRLFESFQIVRQGLEAINVKVLPANAGIFAYIDMRVLMKEETFEEERRLFSRIADVGVVVTPGESCHCPIPGHFRMCYAWMPKESLAEAIRRIVTLAAQE